MPADRLRNFVNRLLGREEPAPGGAPQIALMENEDGQAALRRILPYLFWPSDETSREALSVVAAVIASASAEELPGMEETVRGAWRYARREPEFVDELSGRNGTRDSGVMAVLSFHPSGYVRERVVRQLAKLHDGSEIRYLLLRLNDWVPQVREVARNAVNARLRDDSVTAFTRNFALVARIIAAERADVGGVIDRVASLLGTDAGRAAMRNAIESSTLRTARAFARFVIERVPEGLPVIVRAGAESRDLLIRAWVAASAMRAVPREEALPLLQRLSADSSPAVRRESLIALAEHFSHEAQPHLLRAVFDSSASIREIARFRLRGPIDFRAMYLDAMSAATTPRALATAISGLAEVGVGADAEIAVPHLVARNATVRRAALKCVMKLSAATFGEQALRMLEDPAPRVSAAARDSLQKRITMDRARLAAVIAESPYEHARINAVHLLTRLGKWQAISSLLQASMLADDAVASLARSYVRVWNRNYNQTQTSPSPREVDRLTAALSNAETVLDADDLEEIRFALKAFVRA